MMLGADTLGALPGVRHGFFTRAGGVSEGPFASLNCGFGSGDEAARVIENRDRAMALLELSAETLKRNATAKQGADIDAALHRLVDPGAMGTLFQALAIAHPDAPAPAGFEQLAR